MKFRDCFHHHLVLLVVTANPSRYVADYPSVSMRLKTPLLEVPQNIQIVTRQVLKDQHIFNAGQRRCLWLLQCGNPKTYRITKGEFLDLDTFVSVLKSGSPIIIFMGLSKFVQLSSQLIEQSIPEDTNVQILSKVSQPNAIAVESTLETIAQLVKSKKSSMPALVIVGLIVYSLILSNWAFLRN